MTEVPVALDDIVRTREELVANAVGRLPDAHRRFLLSLEKGDPDCTLRDLVNAPKERLDVEYKASLNFEDRGVRVRLAKHFGALANHGSGFVMFGIVGDMTPAAGCGAEEYQS